MTPAGIRASTAGSRHTSVSNAAPPAFLDACDRAGILVMDENPARRNNRLALLREVRRAFNGVADLSRLPG